MQLFQLEIVFIFIYRDAIVINIVSFLTSLYAGIAVFSIIGYMANEYEVDIEKVINSGEFANFVLYRFHEMMFNI